ncbi:MAG: hypothetical protein ACM34K_10940 [Bacillota bacterium]
MEQTGKIEFRKVRDFGETINATFEFLKQNYKGLGLSLLYIAGPAVVLHGIVAGMNNVDVTNSRSFSFSFAYFLTFLVYIAVTQLVVSVSYGYINLYLDNEKKEFSVDEVWEEVKRNIKPLFLTGLVSLFLILLASLALIIPGIYFSVVLSIVFIVKIRENGKIPDAIARSRYLITGNWWYTFGLVIILYIIQYVFTFVLGVPQSILMFSAMFGLRGETSYAGSVIFILTTIIASFSSLFNVIFHTGMSFHYYSQLEKKEAVGLMDKLDSIKEPD